MSQGHRQAQQRTNRFARARRFVGAGLAVVLSATSLLALQSTTTTADAAEAGWLTTSGPDPVMRNEEITLDGGLPPTTRSRPITIQRRLDGGPWTTVRSTWSRSANGTFTFDVSAPSNGATSFGYRVIAPAATLGGVRYPAVETPPVDRAITNQAAWLDGPARVLRGSGFALSAVFHPARAGRTMALERRSGSQWVLVTTRTQGANGTVSFPRPGTQTLGLTDYRVVARGYRGAAAFSSNTVGVRVVSSGDVSPPAVPGGLAGVLQGSPPGADLTWGAVNGAGAGYRVYRGLTANGPWSRLTPTQVSATSYRDADATSTAPWYAVSSIDTSGNESARGPAVRPEPPTTDTTPPTVPTGLEAEPGDRQVALDWADVNAADLASYRVYRATSADGPWTQVGGDLGDSAHTVTGLTNATAYWFSVTALDTSGNESGRSAPVSATPADALAPPVPTGLAATRGDGEAALDWADVDDADLATYRVYRADSADGPWTQVGGDAITASAHTVTGLTNGTTYWFAVTSVDAAGNESDRSEAASATPRDGTPPGVPTGLVATAGDGKALLDWDDSTAGDLFDYLIYSATSTDGPWQLVDAAFVSSRTINGLTNGTTYWFAVSARDQQNNQSARSQSQSATPHDLTPPPVPGAPVATPGDRQVTLTWAPNGAAADRVGYRVYTADSAGGPWTAASGLVTGTTHTVTDLTNGTATWFAVTSVDGSDNESARSAATSATPVDNAPPPVPTVLTADAGDGQVALSWSAVTAPDLAGYRVYRSTNAGGSWTLLPGTITETSYVDEDAANYTSYSYAVASVDELGNISARSQRADATPVLPVTLGVDPGVDTSRFNACQVKADGSMRCWGHYNTIGIAHDGYRNFSTPQAIARPDGVDWAQVSVGHEHACALTVDRRAWCWGVNSYGEVTAPNWESQTPYQVGTGSDWADIDAGHQHTCGVRTDGTVWCWGRNNQGQVGPAGGSPSQPTPVRVGTADDWASVSAGTYFTCALKDDGTAWCWGAGFYGNPSSPQSATPVQVGSATDWSMLAVGVNHTCGIRTGGALWCWGYNGYGQLGTGSTSSGGTPLTRVGTESDWTAVSAHQASTCGVRGGTLWCWGDNSSGQLGDGTSTARLQPTRVGSDADWAGVAAGYGFSCATRISGAAWCWGDHTFSQLGDGSDGEVESPFQVTSATSWTGIAAADPLTTCGVRADHTAWCWGNNGLGSFGTGSIGGPSTPTQVLGTDWAVVDGGRDFTCGLRTDHSAWCWGTNQQGQLGLGSPDNTFHNTPARVGTASDWEVLATAYGHTCGIRTPGTLWCWGNNAQGRLGDGTTTDRAAPVQIGTDSDWRSVAAGDSHTCAAKEAGTVWCWGANNAGQLGNDNYGAVQSIPIQVGTATDWDAVAVGSYHTCATRTDGTAWCWGNNVSRELGGPSSPDPYRSPQPQQVGTASDWIQITAGGGYTCGTRSDDTGWCWGWNTAGQLGDGTKTQRPAPTQVPGSWTRIDAGNGGTTCGLQPDGTAWCWGSNFTGAVGSPMFRPTPGPVDD